MPFDEDGGASTECSLFVMCLCIFGRLFFFSLGGGRGVCAVTLPPPSGEAEDCTVSSDDNVDLRLTPLKSDKKQPNKLLSVKYIL